MADSHHLHEGPGPAGEVAHLVCVLCPTGCRLTTGRTASGEARVSGASCVRGREYAEMEASSPMRTFTGTMRVAGGEFPVVPVRSATAVERDALLALAKTVAGALAKAPVSIGDVVLVTDESVVLVATASVAPDTGNR